MISGAVLIVDDNPTNLKLARVVLSAEGLEVRTAISAEEALNVLLSPAKHSDIPELGNYTLARRKSFRPVTVIGRTQ
jgi:CheY-like chemotaxis protein